MLDPGSQTRAFTTSLKAPLATRMALLVTRAHLLACRGLFECPRHLNVRIFDIMHFRSPSLILPLIAEASRAGHGSTTFETDSLQAGTAIVTRYSSRRKSCA
ncbi:hypothetical protein VTK56DRAFT_3886 [Thermocarpiscus australiensis]